MLHLRTNMNCAKEFIKVFETLYSCTALLGPHLCIVKPKYLQHITGLSHYVQLQRLGLNLGYTECRDLPKPHFQHSAKGGYWPCSYYFPRLAKQNKLTSQNTKKYSITHYAIQTKVNALSILWW